MAAFIPAAVKPPSGVERSQFRPGSQMQNVLFNMFKERQGGFYGVPGEGTDVPGSRPKQGVNDARSLVHSQGLLWGFLDPRWFKVPKPPSMEDVIYNSIDPMGGGGGGGGGSEVSTNPVGDPIEYEGNLSIPPMPAPKNEYGHWEYVDGPAPSEPGHWIWIQDIVPKKGPAY